MSSKKWHEYSEEEILRANIEKYQRDDIVKFYEDFEEPRYSYIEYQIILAAVLKAMREKLGRPVRAVDMCGGAGKAAFVIKSIQPDSEVFLVDLSDKMLNIARQRAAKLGLELNIVEADAFSFLEQDVEYDLFVYSSALHHFKDPINLLKVSAGRMNPKGMIVTIADPTTLIKSRRYRFFQFLATKRDVKLHLVKQCFQRRIKKAATADEEFDVAEYQTYTGIDDHQLCRDLASIDLYPLLHLRYPAGEPYMTKIMPYLGLCWAFSTVICLSPDDYQANVELMKQEIKSQLPFRIRFF